MNAKIITKNTAAPFGARQAKSTKKAQNMKTGNNKRIKQEKGCIFCKIVAEELPATIVYEDEDFMAFKDLYPQAPVHVLIIPKKHIATVNDIQEEDQKFMVRIWELAKSVARQLNIEDGYQLKINVGQKAGQVVFHLHMHVMGGWKGKRLATRV